MRGTGPLELFKFKLFLVFFFPLVFLAQVHPDKQVDSLLRTGIDRIMMQEYDSARSCFRQLGKEYPRLPLSEIYLAAVSISESSDFGTRPTGQEVFNLLESADLKTSAIIKSEGGTAWTSYYKALSLSYRAYFHSLRRDFLEAFSIALEALDHFEDSFEKDTSFSDAYIAIGTYKYWKSRKTEWIPLISNEKEIGIYFLEKGTKLNSYNRYLGIISLVWIYIDRKEFKKAADLSMNLLKKFPDNRQFLYSLARAKESDDSNGALNTYEKLLESYKDKIPEYSFRILIIRHKIARILYELGRLEEAEKVCNMILNSAVDNERFGKRLEDIRNLRDKLRHEMMNSGR